MWVLFDGGFVSIVKKDGKKGELCVRARVKNDLLAFMSHAGGFKPIITTPKGDYRYRTWLPAKTVARALGTIALTVDYDNFKSRVLLKQGQARAHVYGGVWSELYRLQKE